MNCWYCYWGWAKPVAEIYKEAEAKLEDSTFLNNGPGHIVWSDENFQDEHIQSCIDWCDNPPFDYESTPEDIAIIKESLLKLLAIPEEIRCCKPKDYDGEHPENYPPTIEVIKL